MNWSKAVKLISKKSFEELKQLSLYIESVLIVEESLQKKWHLEILFDIVQHELKDKQKFKNRQSGNKRVKC